MVDSEWFGIINDTGYFLTDNPYDDIEKVMPYTVNFQLKESVFGAKSTVKIDLQKIMDILKKSNYRGYVPLETLSAAGGNKNKTAASSNEKRPAYDAYSAVPAFYKKVKAAQKEAFSL